jgi:hypothetical protein
MNIPKNMKLGDSPICGTSPLKGLSALCAAKIKCTSSPWEKLHVRHKGVQRMPCSLHVNCTRQHFHHRHLIECDLFLPWYSWKIAHLALNYNHWLLLMKWCWLCTRATHLHCSWGFLIVKQQFTIWLVIVIKKKLKNLVLWLNVHIFLFI